MLGPKQGMGQRLNNNKTRDNSVKEMIRNNKENFLQPQRRQSPKGSSHPAPLMVKINHKGNLPGTQSLRLEAETEKLLGKKKKKTTYKGRHELPKSKSECSNCVHGLHNSEGT